MAELSELMDRFRDYLRLSTTGSISTQRKYHSIVKLYLVDNAMVVSLGNINNWLSTRNRVKNTYIYKYALKHFLISIGKKEWGDKLIVSKRSKRKKALYPLSRIK